MYGSTVSPTWQLTSCVLVCFSEKNNSDGNWALTKKKLKITIANNCWRSPHRQWSNKQMFRATNHQSSSLTAFQWRILTLSSPAMRNGCTSQKPNSTVDSDFIIRMSFKYFYTLVSHYYSLCMVLHLCVCFILYFTCMELQLVSFLLNEYCYVMWCYVQDHTGLTHRF